MASATYYDYTETTALNDDDVFPLAPATAGKYKKIKWSWIKKLLHPTGSFYTQYPAAASNDPAVAFPDSESPAAMFGGTWQLIFSTEGIVFQTEGYDGLGRVNGLMEDQFQGHVMASRGGDYVIGGSEGGNANITTGGGAYKTTWGTGSPSNDLLGNGPPRYGTRTAHRNRLMRVYRRIS